MARNYTKIDGTCDLKEVYGCNAERDKTLFELGYTWDMARDWSPAFTQYWTQRGWDQNKYLQLYEVEAAANDWLWATDTYMGIGIYIRSSFLSQSRGWIKFPDGWFRLRYGCFTGLGRYSGRHPQVYSDRTGANPGSTPGTSLEIDHSGWMNEYNPNRVCLPSTAWGSDYGVVGGLAYTEGIIIEDIRFVGGMSGKNKDTSIFSTGVTMNEPGENSVIRGCMFTDFNNGGLSVFNGTPTHIDRCSFFYNLGPGIDHTGSNGLCNVTITIPSGDNNKEGLIKIRPRDAQSVGGGTFNIRGLKSESRNTLQKPIVVEGSLGQVSLTIDGMTADFSNVSAPELISIEKGNQWEVNIRGMQFSSSAQSILYHAESKMRLNGGQPWTGNSCVVNNEGLKFASRSNMFWANSASPVGSPTIDSFSSNPSSLASSGPVTLSWQTTNATSVSINGIVQTQVDGSAVFQVGPNTTTFTLTSSGPNGTSTAQITVNVTGSGPSSGMLDRNGWSVTVPGTDGLNEALRMIDNSLTTFWMDNASMTVNRSFTVDMKSSKAIKGIKFSPLAGYSNSWPRTFEVQTSGNGSTYTSRGTFTGAFDSKADFIATARYIKVICKTANSNYLNISDFQVLG